VPVATVVVAAGLGEESVAPSLWVFAIGTVLFGLGFGALDSAINAHPASHFGARNINWVHASYGLGATVGPLATTAVLGAGLSWRWVYGAMAVALGAVASISAVVRRSWATSPTPLVPSPTRREKQLGARPRSSGPAKPPATSIFSHLILSGLIFSAVETCIESGAGIWGYVFLTSGRGLSHEAAGLAVATYWAMMLVGRALLGPVAEHTGARPVLGGAVVV
jgi:MFS family permease